MSYPLIISDINKRSQRIKSLLKNKLNKIKIKNLIIVIGGDGFMLKTLKKNKFSPKFFYGINSGDYGFLMNKFSGEKILKLKLIKELNLNCYTTKIEVYKKK